MLVLLFILTSLLIKMAQNKRPASCLTEDEDDFNFVEMEEDDGLKFYDNDHDDLVEYSSSNSVKNQAIDKDDLYLTVVEASEPSMEFPMGRVKKNRSAYNLFIKDRVLWPSSSSLSASIPNSANAAPKKRWPLSRKSGENCPTKTVACSN